jgi:Phosphoglucomutase/phosphomannomutase, alpha/beta/alpha domain I
MESLAWPQGDFVMVRKHFGTDGIRGRANGKITAEVALKVGQAPGPAFHRGEHRRRVSLRTQICAGAIRCAISTISKWRVERDD